MPKILLECELPWPPSVNHYWHQVGAGKARRVYLSARAKQFCADVQAAVLQLRAHQRSTARLGGSFEFLPPDRRTRDIDNLLKGLLDSMCKAGVYVDDSQFDELRLSRGQCAPGGVVRVRVWEIGGTT